MEPRIWAPGDGVALAAWGNLFISVLTGKLVPEGLDRIVAAADEVMADHGKIVNVTVAPDGLPMPDKVYREYSAGIIEARKDTTLHNLLVLEGDGFWLATARMIISGLERLSGGGAQLEVVRSLEEAIGVCEPRVHGVSEPSQLLASVNAWASEYR